MDSSNPQFWANMMTKAQKKANKAMAVVNGLSNSSTHVPQFYSTTSNDSQFLKMMVQSQRKSDELMAEMNAYVESSRKKADAAMAALNGNSNPRPHLPQLYSTTSSESQFAKILAQSQRESDKRMAEMNAYVESSRKKADEEMVKLNAYMNSDECSPEERSQIQFQLASMNNAHQMQMANIQMAGMRQRQGIVDNMNQAYQNDALKMAGVIPEKVVNGVAYYYENPMHKAAGP